MSKIHPKELHHQVGEGHPVQIVDVRSPSEFAAGHVPGAINLPMDQIESRLEDLLEHHPVVLVCQSGRRAEMTQQILKGRRTALVLEGGTKGWIDQGHKVVRNARCRWSLERQVRLTAGLLVLLGLALAFFVNPAWIGLTAFVGLGLTVAGLTDFCAMASLYALMPWNKSCAIPQTRRAA